MTAKVLEGHTILNFAGKVGLAPCGDMSLPLGKAFGIEFFVNGEGVCFLGGQFVPAWRMQTSTNAESTNMEVRKRKITFTFNIHQFLAKPQAHEIEYSLFQATPRKTHIGQMNLKLIRNSSSSLEHVLFSIVFQKTVPYSL